MFWKFSILFLFSFLLSKVYTVTNDKLGKIKLCKDCKFFIPDKKKCSQFGYTDYVLGKHEYESSLVSRENKNKCGINAVYFEENKYKFMTFSYYFVKENFDTFIILFTYCIYVWKLIK